MIFWQNSETLITRVINNRIARSFCESIVDRKIVDNQKLSYIQESMLHWSVVYSNLRQCCQDSNRETFSRRISNNLIEKDFSSPKNSTLDRLDVFSSLEIIHNSQPVAKPFPVFFHNQEINFYSFNAKRTCISQNINSRQRFKKYIN